MRRLQRRQRDELSLTTAPIRTMQYFTLAVVEQVSAVCSALSSSRAALVALLGCLWLLSLLIAVDRPQNSVSAPLHSEPFLLRFGGSCLRGCYQLGCCLLHIRTWPPCVKRAIHLLDFFLISVSYNYCRGGTTVSVSVLAGLHVSITLP